jgi:hypothetical protein
MTKRIYIDGLARSSFIDEPSEASDPLSESDVHLEWSAGKAHAYVLGSAESDTSDTGDVLQAELANGLAGLLLVARVNGDGGTTGDGGLLASLGLRVAAGIFDLGLGDLIVREFFNTGIGHFVR